MTSGDLTFHRRWSGDEEVLPTGFRWNGQPLVVLNLNDTSYRRVIEVLREKGLDLIADMIAEQAKPRPEEPQEIGAVVVDAEGRFWTLATKASATPWGEVGDLRWRKWDDIDAVREVRP